MSKEKILVVDDTVSSLIWLAQLMSDEGYEVICAKSGEKALELLDSLAPTLILLDVNMPGLGGVELCRRIKEKPDLSAVPVLFQSVSTDSETKIEGLKAGAADFVSKPYQPEEIILRVRTHLELYRFRTMLEKMVEVRTRQLRNEVNERRQAEQETAASKQKLRELGAHLQEVREEERKRIAREIHDALGQSLSVAQIELKRLEAAIKNGEQEMDAMVSGLRGSLNDAAETARNISENLRPGTLDVLGLGPTLENLVAKFAASTGIDCRAQVELSEDLEIEDRHATTLYRIAQESLTNVAKHAQATDVRVHLIGSEEGLILTVHDNGVGLTSASESGRQGFGLRGMQERAEILGGSLSLESDEGLGTQVEVFLPLRELDIDD